MQLHAALRDDPSFFSTLKRQLSRRGSLSAKKHNNRERSTSNVNVNVNTNTNARPSRLALDMQKRVDWNARTEAWLDEPATRPAQTTLLLEIPDLQSICLTHGERLFRIERQGAITVRDVLIELDKFLHRPAPKLVGNFRTWKKIDDGDGDDEELEQQPHSPKAVNLEVVTAESPDSSESSLASDGERKHKPVESVLSRWLGEKTVFAGLRRAENHDFKLLVKMVKPDKDAAHLG